MLTAPAALAEDGPFTIDGNVPDAGTTQLSDPFGNVQELGPLNSNTTKIGVINRDAVPTLGTTNPNAQVDLRQAWLDTAQDGNGDYWLYFAWERDKNTGSGFIAYEFMKNPAPAACAYLTATQAQLIAACNPWANREEGDFVILWDQQGGNRTLVIRYWEGTAPILTLGAPSDLDATVSAAQYSGDGFKGEAAVNLSATIFAESDDCQSFSNTIPSTVTGNSDTADYKDTILTPTPPISNCTSATVTTPKLADGETNIPEGGLDLGPAGVDVTDSAVVSLTGGTATPAGTVTFYLCQVDEPDLCTSEDNPVGDPKSLTGETYPATVVSDVATVTEPGRYCFRAVYSGDSANGIPGSSDSSATECFIVNAVASTLSTEQTWVPNDSITVTALAGGPLDGTVTVTLYPNGTCDDTDDAIYTDTLDVSGDPPQTVLTANTTAVTESGSFSWQVSYDSENPAQLDIPASCEETSVLTIDNDGEQPE
ncbi:MAG: hemagglutinin [Microbacterium sp.]